MNPTAPAHPVGATPGVKPTYPAQACRVDRCEIELHIGLFFDGTANNMYQHQTLRKDSNVARLYRAYPLMPKEGYFPVYIPGVGTPFPEIGEDRPKDLGQAFGAGGDGRINYGLLHVLNSIYLASSRMGQPALNPDTIKALCRNGPRRPVPNRVNLSALTELATKSDERALGAVAMDRRGGLLLDAQGSLRSEFLRQQAARIARQVQETMKPKIIGINIDVFGFSRGAAEARVFCSWLDELFDGDTLCGVPTMLRFVGLFDTVASVGVPSPMPLVGGLADGHLAWATAHNLRVPPRVKNCVHYVAMHENRASFPVESVRQGNVLPGNCQEFMFPGMHADVGGGYAPGEQGRDPEGEDEEKLSQIPLLRMYEAAQKGAKVPLNKELAKIVAVSSAYDPFAVAPSILKAYEAFIAATGTKARPFREWLLPYLVWRCRVCKDYDKMDWSWRASHTDRADLVGANATLQADIEALYATRTAWREAWLLFFAANPLTSTFATATFARTRRLAPEARELLKQIQTYPPIPAAMATLFADHAHDSYAGFRPFDQLTVLGWDFVPGSWEPEGYLRYRRHYRGDNQQLVQNQSEPAQEIG